MWTISQQLWTSGVALVWISIKALLLYLTAVLGFRIGERRTLAEMSAFDFVAAVASGAIVGRVPNSNTTSYLAGAGTLITILVAHALLARIRLHPSGARLLDHPPRILVFHGEIREAELKRCGLTKQDLHGLLRERDIASLAEVHVAIFEQRGKVSVIRERPGEEPEPQLVKDILSA